ncbi:unnamed protein product [Mytilus edulis]|uniref:Dynein regulatory complex protein 10 n=1 Tax=Mytilus edulis TaxID=6550 RepID=A0A8S3UA95_MYTED|nr:unnamed protein product [Mytilus edulis]
MATTAMRTQTLTGSIATEPILNMKLTVPVPPQKGGPGKIRNRLRLDPARALEPARKKIATVEAQRVMSVFEDTIQRIEISSMIPYILENLDRFRISFGVELCSLLENHSIIIGSYNEIKEQLDRQMQRNRIRSASSVRSDASQEQQNDMNETQPTAEDDEDEDSVYGGQSPPQSPVNKPPSRGSSASSRRSNPSVASFDSQTERTMRNLSLVAQQLSSSCKNILRQFQINGSAFNSVKTHFHARPKESTQLLSYMNDLRDILLNKLLTTPKKRKSEWLTSRKFQKERETMLLLLLRWKRNLTLQLQIRKRRIKNEQDKQESADKKNHEGKVQRLQNEIVQLKTQLQNLVLEHREKEQDLRRMKFKVESQVEGLIQKYDGEMNERQEEYEEIEAAYNAQKKQLDEVEERFKTMSAEYDQIQEERRLAREKREAAEREMALMVKAATTVQAFWRSFKVRKALKARKKKGGGKKGKK